MLLFMECNASTLNKIAQNVFEDMEIEKREKMHILLLDSPVEKSLSVWFAKIRAMVWR